MSDVSIAGAVRQTKTMTMRADKDKSPSAAPYADEVLCANWHPLALLLVEPLACVQKTALEAGDVEDFLARLYLAQRA